MHDVSLHHDVRSGRPSGWYAAVTTAMSGTWARHQEFDERHVIGTEGSWEAASTAVPGVIMLADRR
jgi:hypothetical protein